MRQELQKLYEQFITEVVNQAWFYPLLTALGIFFILLLIAGVRRHQRKSMRVYRDESGNASVTRKALKDLVHLACARIDTASKPKIEIRPHRGRLDLTIRIKLYEGQRLSDLRDKLRRSVIHTFEESHGIRLGDINVLVIGFKKGAHISAPEFEDDEKVDTVKTPMSEEPKEKKSALEPDLATVTALSGGAEAGHIPSNNSPELEPVEDNSLTPAEDKPKKKSFFSWGRKGDTEEETSEEEATSEESVEPTASEEDSEKK